MMETERSVITLALPIVCSNVSGKEDKGTLLMVTVAGSDEGVVSLIVNVAVASELKVMGSDCAVPSTKNKNNAQKKQCDETFTLSS